MTKTKHLKEGKIKGSSYSQAYRCKRFCKGKPRGEVKQALAGLDNRNR